MNAILSKSIQFISKEDVEAYKQLSAEAIREDGFRYSDVGSYKIGFQNIVLLDDNGYVIAKTRRGDIRGLAVDDVPITLHGDLFKPIEGPFRSVTLGEDVFAPIEGGEVEEITAEV